MDAFYALALLACPVGMGAMMWFMMKGNKQPSHGQQAPAPQDRAADYADLDAALRAQEAAALRQEIAELRARIETQQGSRTGEHTR